MKLFVSIFTTSSQTRAEVLFFIIFLTGATTSTIGEATRSTRMTLQSRQVRQNGGGNHLLHHLHIQLLHQQHLSEDLHTQKKSGVIINIFIFKDISWKIVRMPTCLNQGRGRGWSHLHFHHHLHHQQTHCRQLHHHCQAVISRGRGFQGAQELQ